MQFTYPAFLWALLLVAVPIIIHLFNFRKYKTVYFSNVRFLQDIKRETKSKATLRNLLLLISRIFVLVFLVLAFAKPYIPVSDNSRQTDHKRVVVYIDNSFSMESEGKFGVLIENAKMSARKLADAYPLDAEFLLLTNDLDPVHHQFVTRDQFIDFISDVKSTHVQRNINDVLEKSQALWQNNDTASEVQFCLISDFQKSAIGQNQFHVGKRTVFVLPLENTRKSNLYVDTVWFETVGHYKGKREKVIARIMNQSSENYQAIPLSLNINDTLVNTVTFSVGAHSDVMVAVPFVRWHSGANFASIHVNDFPITFDNDYYFNWNIQDKIKLLFIQESDSVNYLKQLYVVGNSFTIHQENINAITYSLFPDYQLIVLNQATHISSGLKAELTKYVQEGGHVLVIPEKKADLKQYNAFLNSVSGIQMQSWRDEKGNISKLDINHPFFNRSLELNEKTKLPFYSGYFNLQLSGHSRATVLLKSASGNAVFVECPAGKGKLFVTGFPLSPDITDFGTHPLLVPLFYNLALNSNGQNNDAYIIDPSLQVVLNVSNYNDNPVLFSHRLKDLQFYPKSNFIGGVLRIFPDDRKLLSGSYQVWSGNECLGGVSLNYNRNESVLTFYSPDEVQQILKKRGIENQVQINQQQTDIQSQITQENKKNDLSQFMLWLMLTFLLFEMVIIRWLL